MSLLVLVIPLALSLTLVVGTLGFWLYRRNKRPPIDEMETDLGKILAKAEQSLPPVASKTWSYQENGEPKKKPIVVEHLDLIAATWPPGSTAPTLTPPKPADTTAPTPGGTPSR